MLFLTICILIVYVLISYVLFDRDLLAPPTVVSLGFLFSALCAFYNEKKWALEFSSDTVIIIAVGVGVFIVGGLIAVLITNISKPNKIGFSHILSSAEPINIEASKTVAIILFQIILAIILFFQLRQITGESSWVNVVTAYRLLTGRLRDLNDYSVNLPTLLRQFLEINFAVGLIYAYVIGNNIAARKKQTKLNWVPIILCCIITFMQGYRSDMLRLWIAVLIVAYTLRKRSVGWANSKETKKMIKNVSLSIIGIAILFVMLRGTVGRAETDWDPLYYVTFYAGSPIAALDLFLKQPYPASDIWGKETFYNLNQSIRVLFDHPELKYIFYKEFRQSPNGTYIGNVYTALRPPYYDFGFIGMVIVMLLMGALFTFLYCKIRNRYGKKPIDFRLLLYAYIAYTFFLYFYNCYNNFISHAFIKLIIELFVVRWFLVGWHLKKRYSVKFGNSKKVGFGSKWDVW